MARFKYSIPVDMVDLITLHAQDDLQKRGLLHCIYRKDSTELAQLISDITAALDKLEYTPVIRTRDNYAFILDAILHTNDISMKLFIGMEFVEFLNNTHKFELNISNSELNRAITYALAPNPVDTFKVSAILERIWKGLLKFEKEETPGVLVVYLFISMFYDTGNKLVRSAELTGQFHSLMFLHWHSSFLRTEATINTVIHQLLLDLDAAVKVDYYINVIPMYAHVAMFILFIEIDHLASVQHIGMYQSITARLAKACCDTATCSSQ